MMKKTIVLWLLLLVWGGALVSAQVRIGGSGDPNAAAVLDLNTDNTATPTGNKGALALPRINLGSVSATLNGTTPLNGMLVYHTGSTLSGAGVYVWTGSQWTKVNAGALTITNGMIAANAVDSTQIVNSGKRIGLNNIADNVVSSAKIMDGTIQTVDMANAAVTGAKIATNTIPLDRIQTSKSDSAKFMVSNGTNWYAMNLGFETLDSISVSMPGISNVVTWSIVLDVPIEFALLPHHFIRIMAPSVKADDFCHVTSNILGMYVSATPGNGSIELHNPSLLRTNSYTGTSRLRCFRAAF
jgi:hypothetical protein